jgi:hypothetical protein
VVLPLNAPSSSKLVDRSSPSNFLTPWPLESSRKQAHR